MLAFNCDGREILYCTCRACIVEAVLSRVGEFEFNNSSAHHLHFIFDLLVACTMSIPSGVLFHKHKRSRSFDEDDIDSTVTLTVQSEAEESISAYFPRKYFVVAIVVCIFCSGFILGQVVPSLLENQTTLIKTPMQSSIDVYPTPSPVAIATANKPTALPTKIRGPNVNLLSKLVGSVDKKLKLLPSPTTDHADDIQIYSTDALNKLKKGLSAAKRVRICVNGGSSSAGGGHIRESDRYYSRFVKSLKLTNVEIYDRSHGSRTSLHSAIMAESFFPTEKPDLLLWEFGINDEGGNEASNQFILWMRKVKSYYNGDPPPVLLIYLWSQPFTVDSKKVRSTVFRVHNRVGAEFDFCVGHVHLASYLDQLSWGGEDLSNHFLADKHHPNELSHALVAKMMETLISSKTTTAGDKPKQQNSKYEWKCGDDPSLAPIRSLFVDGTESKGSFTADLPKNNASNTERMLIPARTTKNGITSNSTFPTQFYGKIDRVRRDRHRGIKLPCCKEGAIAFELSAYLPVKAMQFMIQPEGQGDGGLLRRRLSTLTGKLMDAFQKDDTPAGHITITLNDKALKVVDAGDFDCLLNNAVFRNWVVFEDPDFVDEVKFCSNQCDDVVNLEQVVIF